MMQIKVSYKKFTHRNYHAFTDKTSCNYTNVCTYDINSYIKSMYTCSYQDEAGIYKSLTPAPIRQLSNESVSVPTYDRYSSIMYRSS